VTWRRADWNAFSFVLAVLLCLLALTFGRPIFTDLLKSLQVLGSPYPAGVDLFSAICTGLLAIGTFVLAAFSYFSVRAAVSQAAGEDKRQEKSLAPLLTIEPRMRDDKIAGLRIRNVGIGPAQNLVLGVRSNVPSTGMVVRSYSAKTFLEAERSVFWDFSFKDELEFTGEDEINRYSIQVAAAVSCYDLSGNEYRTINSDATEPSDMIWLRPKMLYSSRTLLEDRFDAYVEFDDLLDHLEFSGTLAGP
jgi:hypothetical protein